jgi:hypothetical protein
MIEQHRYHPPRKSNHALRQVCRRLFTIIPCALACCLALI